MDWRRLTRHSLLLALNQCPRADLEVTLLPGEALFIPTTWFYWITSLSDKDQANVAITRSYRIEDIMEDGIVRCNECEMAKDQPVPPYSIVPFIKQPTASFELRDMEHSQLPVKLEYRGSTLNVDLLVQNTISVPCTRSKTNQFVSEEIQDVFPELCQSENVPLNEFYNKKDPNTCLSRCSIDGLDDVYDKTGSIPYNKQELWISFGKNCQQPAQSDDTSSILLQIKGKKTIHLWRPCFRDKLVTRWPVSTKNLCNCIS